MLDAWCCHARFLCATVPVRDSHTLLWDPGQCSCVQNFLGASLSMVVLCIEHRARGALSPARPCAALLQTQDALALQPVRIRARWQSQQVVQVTVASEGGCETMRQFLNVIRSYPLAPAFDICGLHANVYITSDQNETCGLFASVLSLQPLALSAPAAVATGGAGGGGSWEEAVAVRCTAFAAARAAAVPPRRGRGVLPDDVRGEDEHGARAGVHKVRHLWTLSSGCSGPVSKFLQRPLARAAGLS
jgi:hypothetical protein